MQLRVELFKQNFKWSKAIELWCRNPNYAKLATFKANSEVIQDYRHTSLPLSILTLWRQKITGRDKLEFLCKWKSFSSTQIDYSHFPIEWPLITSRYGEQGRPLINPLSLQPSGVLYTYVIRGDRISRARLSFIKFSQGNVITKLLTCYHANPFTYFPTINTPALFDRTLFVMC